MQFILDRKRFLTGVMDDFAFGIERLITDEVYLAAYPLHDVNKIKLIVFNYYYYEIIIFINNIQIG